MSVRILPSRTVAEVAIVLIARTRAHAHRRNIWRNGNRRDGSRRRDSGKGDWVNGMVPSRLGFAGDTTGNSRHSKHSLFSLSDRKLKVSR